ncbi:Lrp/AsnC family transcriptional regulator [Leucobacter sp. CSA2]|uniref:Lrp/AsnC family transcriptional regulator n=1 Tax=Leucobacter edaphi TaxID=2796472 RepID=A0A934QEC8_9MICO|nr:Lrp/AsnC family transcriptional regulator [Leucobacter edaphi]MBK0421552.1 Lrp/AsnC family transcriptional regulator [Leucobacter edaphi]
MNRRNTAQGPGDSTEFDELRAHVFRELRADGRASYARIAERHGATRRQVTQIVQGALARGELRITVSISPDLLGHRRFAYLQIDVDGPIAPTRRALLEMTETTFVAEISGSYAIDAELRVGADPHLRDTVDHIRQLPSVREVRLHLYESIEVNLYSPLRTGRVAVTLDDADRSIVRRLQQDGRSTFRELGDAAGISASGARLRLSRLTRAGAVKVVGIPVRGSGHESPTLGVGVQVHGRISQALARIRELQPEFIAISAGGFDLIVTLSADSNEELLELADQLRSLPEVAHIQSWANLRILKEQYGEGDRLSGAAPGPSTETS